MRLATTRPVALLALCLCTVAAHQSAPPATVQHVLLVSIDGLRPEFYRDPGWPAPTIQQLAAAGVSADKVRGVYPTMTYPSHTTIITGARPARHGILFNTPFEPDGQTGRWYWEEAGILVPTLWDAVRNAGGTSASIAWPVSVGAPIDYNIPEVWSLQDGFGTVEPLRQAASPAGLFDELEREATGRISDEDLSVDYLRREALFASMAAYLIETYRPTLTTVHLTSVDHFTHDDGRDSGRVRSALAAADTAVRALLDATERAGIAERTAVVITGDHGFIDVHSVLAPNVWLARAGLTGAARDRGDWRATFHTNSASAFLYLRDPEDAAVEQQVRDVLASLPASERRLFRVIERQELDRLGAAPDAVLALAPITGISMSSSAREPLLRRGSGATHGFHPELDQIQTGFIGTGAGFATGVVVARMGLEDIAPAIAALLELEFDAPDGTLYPGVLSPRR